MIEVLGKRTVGSLSGGSAGPAEAAAALGVAVASPFKITQPSLKTQKKNRLS
jgi:hypothetical protein